MSRGILEQVFSRSEQKLRNTHRSRQDVMRAAVQEVAFADAFIWELDPLPRLVSWKSQRKNNEQDLTYLIAGTRYPLL